MASEHHATTVFQWVGVPAEYNHVAAAGLVAVVLTAGGLIIRGKLSNVEDKILPEPRLSFLNVMVGIAQVWKNLLNNIIGPEGEKFLPFVGATFCFILLNNLLGLIPGFFAATTVFWTNLAMALFVFVFYHFLGFREHGLHYFQQFTGGLPPKGYGTLLTIFLSVIAVVMFVIETLGHLIRPMSLSIRLWGNMTGDHTLLEVFSSICPIGVPIVFLALGVFVSVVQAFVFSLLSTVYIKLAISHDH